MQVFRAFLNILSGFRVHPELAAKLILFVIHISYFVVHPKSYYILSILIWRKGILHILSGLRLILSLLPNLHCSSEYFTELSTVTGKNFLKSVSKLGDDETT